MQCSLDKRFDQPKLINRTPEYNGEDIGSDRPTHPLLLLTMALVRFPPDPSHCLTISKIHPSSCPR